MARILLSAFDGQEYPWHKSGARNFNLNLPAAMGQSPIPEAKVRWPFSDPPPERDKLETLQTAGPWLHWQ